MTDKSELERVRPEHVPLNTSEKECGTASQPREGGADGEYASESIWRELNGLYEIAKAAWALRTSTDTDAVGKLDEALDFFANVALKTRMARIVKPVPFPTLPAVSRQGGADGREAWEPLIGEVVRTAQGREVGVCETIRTEHGRSGGVFPFGCRMRDGSLQFFNTLGIVPVCRGNGSGVPRDATITLWKDGLEWRVTGLTSLRHTPLDEADERNGVVRYVPAESRQQQASGWVPVAERLPNVGERVVGLLAVDNPEPAIVDYEGAGDFVDAEDDQCRLLVSHWMPLPPPPAKESKP